MLACPWCGTSIDRGHCEACDRPLERDWRVCPWCRTPRQLRAAVPIQQSGDSTPAAAPTASVAADAAPPRSLPRVLVVEDDPSVRAYVKTVLVGTLDVDSVGTAADALELLAEQQYAAVLVDHLLPDMSGVELIRLLKKDAETAGLPVMFFTGDASAGLEAEARDAGADDYLGKPVEPALLEERLLALVQLGTAAPQ
jgi:CheY-like chemotaxis protein